MLLNALKNLIIGRKDEFPKLPTETILTRLFDCRPPGDKRMISEYMEMIEIKLEVFPVETARDFFKFNGIQIMFKIMKAMKNDVDIQCIIVSFVKLLQVDPEVITFLVQMGIIEHLEEIRALHIRNNFIKTIIPDVIKGTLEVGTKQAVVEIVNENTNLQLCKHCVEVVHRNKNSAAATGGNHQRTKKYHSAADTPKDNERINKIIFFMQCYNKSEKIQLSGLDAIIIFARNGDAKTSILDTTALEQAEYALTTFYKNEKILWRAIVALCCMANLRQECAINIMGLNVHNFIANMYQNIDNSRVQQQMLWLLDAFLVWPRSRIELHQSEDCMRLLNELDYDHQLNDESKVANSEKIKNPGVFMTLVIPLKIRTFMRETKGKVLSTDRRIEENKAVIKQSNHLRMKVEEKLNKTLYGTVASKIYVDGDAGLLERDYDKEAQAELDAEEKGKKGKKTKD